MTLAQTIETKLTSKNFEEIETSEKTVITKTFYFENVEGAPEFRFYDCKYPTKMGQEYCPRIVVEIIESPGHQVIVLDFPPDNRFDSKR